MDRRGCGLKSSSSTQHDNGIGSTEDCPAAALSLVAALPFSSVHASLRHQPQQIRLDLIPFYDHLFGDATSNAELEVQAQHWVDAFQAVLEQPTAGDEPLRMSLLPKSCGESKRSLYLSTMDVHEGGGSNTTQVMIPTHADLARLQMQRNQVEALVDGLNGNPAPITQMELAIACLQRMHTGCRVFAWGAGRGTSAMFTVGRSERVCLNDIRQRYGMCSTHPCPLGHGGIGYVTQSMTRAKQEIGAPDNGELHQTTINCFSTPAGSGYMC